MVGRVERQQVGGEGVDIGIGDDGRQHRRHDRQVGIARGGPALGDGEFVPRRAQAAREVAAVGLDGETVAFARGYLAVARLEMEEAEEVRPGFLGIVVGLRGVALDTAEALEELGALLYVVDELGVIGVAAARGRENQLAEIGALQGEIPHREAAVGDRERGLAAVALPFRLRAAAPVERNDVGVHRYAVDLHLDEERVLNLGAGLVVARRAQPCLNAMPLARRGRGGLGRSDEGVGGLGAVARHDGPDGTRGVAVELDQVGGVEVDADLGAGGEQILRADDEIGEVGLAAQLRRLGLGVGEHHHVRRRARRELQLGAAVDRRHGLDGGPVGVRGEPVGDGGGRLGVGGGQGKARDRQHGKAEKGRKG